MIHHPSPWKGEPVPQRRPSALREFARALVTAMGMVLIFVPLGCVAVALTCIGGVVLLTGMILARLCDHASAALAEWSTRS